MPTGVMLVYLHPGTVSSNFMQSVLGLMSYHRQGVEIAPIHSGPRLDLSRNKAVEMFLRSDREWLWFVDSDMGFHANALENLLNVSDVSERPVVGALCFAQVNGEPDGFGGWIPEIFPTLFSFDPEPAAHRDYPRDSLIRVDGTGTACLLIHRSAFEKTSDWFSHVGIMGEDLSFCARLRDAGIPLHVHTGIKTSHQKTTWLKEVT